MECCIVTDTKYNVFYAYLSYTKISICVLPLLAYRSNGSPLLNVKALPLKPNSVP